MVGSLNKNVDMGHPPLHLRTLGRSLDLAFVGLVLRGDLSLIKPLLTALAAYANAHGDLTDQVVIHQNLT